MNERLRRHARLVLAALAVLLVAGLGYVLRSGGSARAQSAHPVALVHAIAPVVAPASARRAAGIPAFVAARVGRRQSAAPSGKRQGAARAGVPTPPPSPRGVSLALQQTTGLSPAQVTSRAVCPRAASGLASCAAQRLVLRSTGAPVRPHVTKYRSLGRVAPAHSQGASPASIPAASPPTPGTPAYLQQAYDLTSLAQTGGSGDTVAVVDAYDDPTAEQDLATYRSTFQLPACTTANGCFQKVGQAGSSSLPAPDASWEQEIALDLDAVSATCPRCHILLVEANSNNFSDLQAAMQTADNLGAKQISASWSGTSTSVPSGFRTFSGVATVAAAGDNGYVGPGQDNYPAALPGVTAAGGTSLGAAGTPSARGFGEAAWSWNGLTGGGSGCDLHFERPVYQPAAGCAGRAYADLSADADPNTGLDVYDNGSWSLIGGTSLATPLISGYYAVTGVAGARPQWAYSNESSLNDVVSGSSGNCAAGIAYICNAGPGYDGPTGAGSISGSVVTGAPGVGGPALSGGQGNPNTYIQSIGSQGATIDGGIYRNGLDTTWWIEYGTTNAYGSQTTAADIGAGSAPVAVTGSLSQLTAGTTYHYRLVAKNSLGTTYGYDYTFSTAAATAPSAAFAVSPSGPTPTSAVTFDASASTPGSGSSLTSYTWSFGDGTPAQTRSSPTIKYTYAARNKYTVTLTVKNRAGQTSSSTQTITVDNPPTAAFTPSATVAAPGAGVSFDGGASTAGSGGAISDYSWNFGDGTVQNAGATPTAAHTYASPGTYTVTLTTTDDLDIANSTTALITVDQPAAAFTIAPAKPAPGDQVTLDASSSTDPQGTISDYSWNFGDGNTFDNGANPVYKYSYGARGQYPVTLTITNNYGQKTTTSQSITVDSPPTAAFTASPTAPSPGAAVTFDASASSAVAGGKITGYSWNFGDGGSASGPQPSHSYTSTGTYTVTLTVTDDLGVAASATAPVVVAAPPAPSPRPVTPTPPTVTPTPPTVTSSPPAQTTPVPQPTPPVSSSASAPPTPSPLVVGLSGGKQRLAVVLAHGLRLRLSVSQGAWASFQVTIPAAHGKRGSKIVLLHGTRALGAGGHVITLRLSRGAVAQLRARGFLVLTIRVTLTSTGRAPVTRTTKVTLTR